MPSAASVATWETEDLQMILLPRALSGRARKLLQFGLFWTSVAVCAATAHGQNVFESESHGFSLDTRSGAKVLGSAYDILPIAYSAGNWGADSGVASVTLTTADGETQILNSAGEGVLNWTPPKVATFTLTHRSTASGGQALTVKFVLSVNSDSFRFDVDARDTIVYSGEYDAMPIAYSPDAWGVVTPGGAASVTIDGERLTTPEDGATEAGYAVWKPSRAGTFVLCHYVGDVLTHQREIFCSENRLKFSYNYPSGQSPEPIVRTYTAGEPFGELPVVPEDKLYAGYAFKGWYTQSKGKGSRLRKDTIVPSSARVYYAQWEKKIDLNEALDNDELTFGTEDTAYDVDASWYGVKLSESVNGSCARSGRLTAYGQTSSLKMTTSRAGKLTFKWKAECVDKSSKLELLQDDAVIYTLTGSTGWYKKTVPVPGGSHTYTWRYAKGGWTDDADECFYVDDVDFQVSDTRVTLNGNGGKSSPNNNTYERFVVSTGSPYGMNLVAFVRAGYAFAGWFTEPEGGQQVSAEDRPQPGDVTLYAHWTAGSVRVKFYYNYGSLMTTAYDERNYVAMTKYGSLPANPEREGYVFTGWYTEPTGGRRITESSGVQANVNAVLLYAHWTSAVQPAGFVTTGNDSVTTGGDSPWFVRYASADTEGDCAERVLQSGVVAPGGVSDLELLLNGPGVLSFERRLDCGAQDSLEIIITGTGSSRRTIAGTEPGVGEWTADSVRVGAGSVKVTFRYRKGTSGAAGADAACLRKVVYARDPNLVTVTFDSAGGTPSVQTASYTSGESYVNFPVRPTKAGYAFAGWFTAASGGTEVRGADAAPAENTTLYAHWEDVAVDFNEAVDNAALTFTFGGSAPWYGQAYYTSDGVDAVRSGKIEAGETSSFSTTVTGPGRISFKPGISCYNWDHCFEFFVDGVMKRAETGYSLNYDRLENHFDLPGWSYSVQAGEHTFSWQYRVGTYYGVSTYQGYDAAFVDGIVWTPFPALDNDDWEQARTIAGLSGSTSVTTLGASLQTPCPLESCEEFAIYFNGSYYGNGEVTAGTVWCKWTAPVTGSAEFRIEPGEGRTDLGLGNWAILTQDAESGWSLLAFDNFRGRLNFACETGRQYYFVYLNPDYACDEPLGVSWQTQAAPENDLFAKAEELSGNSGVTYVNNAGGTLEAGEPLPDVYPDCTQSVWWRWTAPGDGQVMFWTVNSPDTVMAICTGSEVSSLAMLDQNDDTSFWGYWTQSSLVQASVTAGTTYFVCVASAWEQGGELGLCWEFASEDAGLSGYAAWALEQGLEGADAVWNAKPAKWGGRWANAFVYTFGTGILDKSTPLMDIGFDDFGKPVITLAPVVSGRTDFPVRVIGAPSLEDWDEPVGLNPYFDEWTLPLGESANFFRVQLTGSEE